jgi:hypothetical protein
VWGFVVFDRVVMSAFRRCQAAAFGEKIVKEPYDVIAFFHNVYEVCACVCVRCDTLPRHPHLPSPQNAAKFNTVTTCVPRLSGYAVGVLPPKLAGYEIEPENNEETLANMTEFAVVRPFNLTLSSHSLPCLPLPLWCCVQCRLVSCTTSC